MHLLSFYLPHASIWLMLTKERECVLQICKIMRTSAHSTVISTLTKRIRINQNIYIPILEGLWYKQRADVTTVVERKTLICATLYMFFAAAPIHTAFNYLRDSLKWKQNSAALMGWLLLLVCGRESESINIEKAFLSWYESEDAAITLSLHKD